MLGDFCSLYNAALQQRIEAHRRRGVAVSYIDQSNELKATRAADAGLARWSFTAELRVLRRLDQAYKAFFGRCRRGGPPGFPRFRASARFHAATFCVGDGLTIRRSGKLGMVGVPGGIKVRWHRAIPEGAAVKQAVITRQTGNWYAVFSVEIDDAEVIGTTATTIGIDAGLNALVALSNGEIVRRPNWTRRAAKGLRRRQRLVARAVKRSRRNEKARARLAVYHRRCAAGRRDMLHKLSADIVKRFGGIAVEDLNIKGLARGWLAKEVHDAAWAELIWMLTYKAGKAGGVVVKVDPRGTSQTCPECGTIEAKSLDQRTHRCDCGCVLDRDVAAAKIVHLRAFGFGPGTGLQALSGRVAA